MSPSEAGGSTAASAAVHDLETFRAWAARRLAGLTFVGPDPQHALGLAGLIPGFAVLSGRAPSQAVLERGGAVTLQVDEADGADAASLLQTPAIARFLDERGPGSPLFVFKPSHRIEELARAQAWRLLAPPAGVARRWENKIVFSELARKLDLRVPDFRIVGSLLEASATLADLGGDVVVQAPHGYAGARTLRVTHEDDLAAALTVLRSPRLRVARAVHGTPWTVNACVTARGIAASAPTLQLTGVPCLTSRPLGACGNDGASTSAAVPAMRDAAQRLGMALARDGYLGLFGVDFVVDDDGPWVIEVNPRLVSSVGLATQAQVASGRVPLLARHFMALVEPGADGVDLDDDAAPLGASQIVLHNLGQRELVVRGDVGAGSLFVRGSGARWRQSGLSDDGRSSDGRPDLGGQVAEYPDSARDESGRLEVSAVSGLAEVPEGAWLLLPAGKGRLRAPGAEVARLQRRGSVVDRAGGLLDDVEVAARTLYEALDLGLPSSVDAV